MKLIFYVPCISFQVDFFLIVFTFVLAALIFIIIIPILWISISCVKLHSINLLQFLHCFISSLQWNAFLCSPSVLHFICLFAFPYSVFSNSLTQTNPSVPYQLSYNLWTYKFWVNYSLDSLDYYFDLVQGKVDYWGDWEGRSSFAWRSLFSRQKVCWVL